MRFEVGQEVAVSYEGAMRGITRVVKVTHDGKRVTVASLPHSVFDERGREKGQAWHWHTIEPATDAHKQTLADLRERGKLWRALDDGIAASGWETRETARDAVGTAALRQIVALLKGAGR